MKKTKLYLIIFLLMINILCITKCVFAEENESNIQENISEHTNIEENKQSISIIEKAQIKKVNDTYEKDGQIFQDVTIEILNGDYETDNFTLTYNLLNNNKYKLEEDDIVVVNINDDESGNITITILEVDRSNYIIILILVLVIIYVLIMRKKAIKSIIQLFSILAILYFILLKGIITGNNVKFITFITLATISIVSSIVHMGFNRKAISTFLSIVIGTLFTGFIFVIIAKLQKVSIYNEFLLQIMDYSKYTYNNLIFTSMIISSLGINIKIVISMIIELDNEKNKTKDISWKELYKDGVEIGNECIKNMGGAVVLIYFGISLSILLAYISKGYELLEALNTDFIMLMIIFGFTSIIGMMFVVPLTSLIYAMFNHKKSVYRTVSDNKIDGEKRSLKL